MRHAKGLPSNSSQITARRREPLSGQPGLGMNLSWHASIRRARSQRACVSGAGWKILDFGQTVLSDARGNVDPIAVPLSDSIDLGSVDFISAGAISQAALFALSRIPRVEMSGRIFDDDDTEASHLNRNMLTLAAILDSRRWRLLLGLGGVGVNLQPVVGRFPEHSSDIRLSGRVVVGVDDIPSRWKLQERAPNWIAVSGTSHYNASSSVLRPRSPCSGCLHPVDDEGAGQRIPTVSFVSFWAGLAMTVRLLRDALGQPYPPERQHLWLTPLRMDLPHAAMWMPVAPRRDCPVHCLASISMI